MSDPNKVKAGLASARKRWGEPRRVRLDDLTPEQRRVVIALCDAFKATQQPEENRAA